MVMMISRCSKAAPDHNCAADDKIDDFIKRVRVESWTNYDEVDFSKHYEAPVKRHEEWIRSDLLHPEYLI